LVLTGTAPINAAPEGFLEGHLKILSCRPVELADENAATVTEETNADYSLYPLIILSPGEKKEITRVTADRDGNYRVALPPGDYILAVQGRVRRHAHGPPHPFAVVSNQTVHVDMDITPDVSRE
jgi:hypothetical protein